MEKEWGSINFLTNKKSALEIDAKYKAKIAEKNFPRKSISEAMQAGPKKPFKKLRQQVAEEITSLENKAERKKREHSRAKVILFI